jgi:hypothetical protein
MAIQHQFQDQGSCTQSNGQAPASAAKILPGRTYVTLSALAGNMCHLGPECRMGLQLHCGLELPRSGFAKETWGEHNGTSSYAVFPTIRRPSTGPLS